MKAWNDKVRALLVLSVIPVKYANQIHQDCIYRYFMEIIRVLIVEDITDYRQALTLLFNNTRGFSCICDYDSAEGCLQAGAYPDADVAVIDIQLPGMSGIELVKQLQPQKPGLLCVMCTAYEEDEKIFSALEAGAHGYILKSDSPAKILEAVVELYNGGSPMSSQVARKVVQSFKRTPSISSSVLTLREAEVLDLLSKGMLYKEIALRLSISVETVRRHCFNMYQKLHVNNRTEAVNRFLKR